MQSCNNPIEKKDKMIELISVIVPVYKVEEVLLRKCIKSILCQTYSNYELLIIDDGSPDNCGKISDEYAALDKRIHVFHIDNHGVSYARNLALRNAKGKYIYFVDSDDYIESNTLEKLVKVLKDEKCDCVISATSYVDTINMNRRNEKDDVTRKVKYNQSRAINALCYLEQPFENYEIGAVWGTLYTRECISDIFFNTNMKIGEDFEFKYKVFLKANSIVCISDKLYNYIIRENSAMRSGFDTKKYDSFMELKKLMDSTYAFSEYKEALRSRVCNIAIVILFMIPIEKRYERYRKSIKSFLYKNRRKVIANAKSRKKVRLSLLLSYIGFDNVQSLFYLFRK